MEAPGNHPSSSSSALFAALGLCPSGPLDDATLRRAFTAAARRSHPDKQKGGAEAAAPQSTAPHSIISFSSVRAAYEALLPPDARARHASAARTEATGDGTSGGGARAAPAEVDLDEFTWEGGAVEEGPASADTPAAVPRTPAFWLACRCGGRHTVPEADLESASTRGSGTPATILVPCDGCSLVVRAHFCAADGEV